MARIHGRKWRDWSIDFTWPRRPFAAALMTFTDCTLEMTVTPDELKMIILYNDPYREWASAGGLGSYLKVSMRITPEEARDIMENAKYRDPLETLLLPKPYRLVVVPWTPEEKDPLNRRAR